ncbi:MULTISPECIES: hypothetical protein [unclassified Acinetobacter]|uniref:beta family protein n=1 Tax=unclassified Acinetobacter TaxID=196816 RepID=UPI00244B3484|nr:MULTISPECIES: hypothetical protein [unclassified Acinetobacter]MDH0031521.1 beta family protein [Acinetobacter sp. GD04021]MDH0886864.1 beta family protein [Acinetobacter sp. GD03873]MDH1083323.1 beta family protein [Acinetobacter sp. GD03983]MDH2190180.1 beta family protein [Acinetobacter sp. GD03645]MDH2203341.1 beta family protein [Acinetobacter sp. GD03647]
MNINSKYIPFLKFKRNEVYALDDLDTGLKESLSVFFDMPNELPSKSHNGANSFSHKELLDFKNEFFRKKISEQKVYLSKKLNWIDELFIDNYDIDPLVSVDGKTYNYQTIIDEFSSYNMIPVCGVDDRVEEHLNCIIESAKDKKFKTDKIVIRLTDTTFEDYEYIQDDFDTLIKSLSNYFKKIILLFDLRCIADHNKITANILNFLNNLELRDFYKIIVTGSSIPKVISELLSTNTSLDLCRLEVLVFKALKDKKIKFDFGDYTCVSPDTSFLDIYIEEIQSYMTGKIFYPYKNNLFITRSGRLRGKRTPFKPLLDIIVSKTFFRMGHYSKGDKYILEKQPTGEKVNVTSILKPNINLHMTYMLRDFSI